ncbi:MAG: response regulator [Anaerolineae bacterium]|nr:response regulator [Anaerolineae bacterium]MDQ7037047.1 response regulator [Anaerolineae bacterium]
MENPALLYVEDDPESCEIMRLLVEEVMQMNHLTIFEDSHDFLSRLDDLSQQPDIFLLDIHVPPHNGFEMLQMLRQHDKYQSTPVVALTASVMNEEVQQLKTAGFDGVLAKPLDMDAFPIILQRILKGETIWHIMA